MAFVATDYDILRKTEQYRSLQALSRNGEPQPSKRGHVSNAIPFLGLSWLLVKDLL